MSFTSLYGPHHIKNAQSEMMKTRKRIRFADSPVYIYIIYDARQLLQILESSSSNEKNIVRICLVDKTCRRIIHFDLATSE